MTSKKTAKDISRSMSSTEQVGSDEYMRSRGFVEIPQEDSSRYDSIFECADGASVGRRGFLRKLLSGPEALLENAEAAKAHQFRVGVDAAPQPPPIF